MHFINAYIIPYVNGSTDPFVLEIVFLDGIQHTKGQTGPDKAKIQDWRMGGEQG